MPKARFLVAALLVSIVDFTLVAQPRLSDAVEAFVKVDAPVVALTNVRVIDGTGAPARANQTVVIRTATSRLSATRAIQPPAGATTIDLTGKSVMPGLVMVHEHLYYPTGPGVYGQLGESFIRLYLAGGVTTMRTGGNVNGFMDLKLKRLIDAGQRARPGDRCDRAVSERAQYLHADARAERAGRRAAAGGVLGR